MRELSGSQWTAHECFGESLSEVLAEASVLVARQEYRHPATGVLCNADGAIRIYHAEHEDGHQLLVIFEGSKDL